MTSTRCAAGREDSERLTTARGAPSGQLGWTLPLRSTAMSGNKAMAPPTPPSRCSSGKMAGARRSLACNRVVTTSDGVRLSVRDWGSHAAGHTVVLLHGLCLDKDSWNIQITQLIHHWGNSIRIISYDHRGHGHSGDAPMHTYRVDRLADDLAEVLVALGVTGSLTLAGHSMGGM